VTGIIAKRREAGAVCPKCKAPGYVKLDERAVESNRPEFKCTSCGHTWSFGKSGGVYATMLEPNNKRKK
jgi:predicted Zn finger-like uncharacterized protein